MRAWRIAGFLVGMTTGMMGAAGLLESREAHAQSPGPAASERAEKVLEAAHLRAERSYTAGVRALRAERYQDALSFFERAIPLKGGSPNLLFNLVETTRNLRQWNRVALYGQAFMFRERGSQDGMKVAATVDEAFAKLTANGRAPVSYQFDIKPEATQVLIDGVPVSASAVQTVRLSPGKYTMSIARDGYEPLTETLTVTANSGPQVVARTLKAYIYEGRVRVITDPAEGVEVFIDDVRIGVTPIAEMTLQTGRRYLFRFEKEGYDRWWRYIEVLRNDVIELKPVMERTTGMVETLSQNEHFEQTLK
jgi:hypothetical protein